MLPKVDKDNKDNKEELKKAPLKQVLYTKHNQYLMDNKVQGQTLDARTKQYRMSRLLTFSVQHGGVI